MKQFIIVIILLVAWLLVIAFQSLSKQTDNNYFKSYVNTDLIGGYVD